MILLYAIPFLSTVSVCQEDSAPDDSVRIRQHSPTTAIIMSAVLPGLGQIYNGKIWKLPIIYAGEMTAIYSYHFYQIRYQKVLGILKADGGTGQESYDIYGNPIPGTSMARARDFYRRWRDYSGLAIAGIYVLNIIDALVDAYFFEYDISDDLSLNIRPACISTGFDTGGIGLNISMKF
jgi:hypothetical protein